MSSQTTPQDSRIVVDCSAYEQIVPHNPRATKTPSQYCPTCQPSTETGDGLSDWYNLRLRHFKSMRRNLLVILLAVGVLTALEHNTICMIAPGRLGCATKSPEQIEQDYGLFYNTGYVVSYVASCAILSIWIPFFSWWVTKLPVSEAALDDYNAAMMAINHVMLGAHVIYQGICFLCALYALLRFEKGMKGFSPHFDKAFGAWKERSFLVAFALGSVVIGSSALSLLEREEMAKVKNLEYGLVIVPALILIGLRLASKVQWKREQRAISRMAAMRHVEMGVEDEKYGG